MTGSEGSRLRPPVPRHGDLVPRPDRISSSVSRNDQDISVVALGPLDWRDLRAIRLEALRSEPAAFSSTYEETLAWSDEDWRQRLANDERVAVVFGMYVTSEHRGRGIGRLLLTSLIDRLSVLPQIGTIRLGVTETQDPARKLYESVGFRVVGKTEQGIVVHDRHYDELIMELRIR